MTTTSGNANGDVGGRPPIVDLVTWQVAREELLVREKAHTRRGGRNRRGPAAPADGRARRHGRGHRCRRVRALRRPVPGPRRARRLPAHVVRRRPPSGPVRGVHHHGLAHTGPRLPQRPRRVVRHRHLRPVGRGRRLHRVHGLHPAVVLGPRRGGAGRRRDGAHRLLPPRRRPGVPHLLDDRPGQRGGQRIVGRARHDALRSPRGVGGRPRGLAAAHPGRLAGRRARRADLLLLADGRRRRRRRRWAPTSRPVPQWTRPGANPVKTLGRQGDH